MPVGLGRAELDYPAQLPLGSKNVFLLAPREGLRALLVVPDLPSCKWDLRDIGGGIFPPREEASCRGSSSQCSMWKGIL